MLPEVDRALRDALFHKAEYQAAAARLAASGYVAATINHRLAPGAPFPAAVRDASCALSFLRAGAGPPPSGR